MPTRLLPRLLIALALAATGAARADLVPVGDLGLVSAPGAKAFSNSNVTVGTITTSGPITYNFLDKWRFSLDALASISSIVAAINFTDASGSAVLFGISNLQVNLVSDPVSGPPLVSWLTVSTPAAGLQQLVALVPPAPLAGGNYMLEVRGTVSQPGAYSGSLIANTPPSVVPLPAALPLLLAGLAALGTTGWRRKT
jgi:hypothetical protein